MAQPELPGLVAQSAPVVHDEARRFRLLAALAYEGREDEAELCAYQRDFVDGKPSEAANLKPTLETLERIAKAIADAVADERAY